MSKSLGNVLLVHDLVEKTPGEVVRWALLSAHYRAPLDWTGELLEQSKEALNRLYKVIQDSRRAGKLVAPLGEDTLTAGVVQALEDDLNTPRAIAALFDLAKQLRLAIMSKDLEAAFSLERALVDGGRLLGVLQADPDTWFKGGADADLSEQVEALISRRGEARKAKDWPEADRIRGELAALNVEVLDGPGGAASWRLKV